MPQAWQTDIAESISTTPAAGQPAEAVHDLRAGVTAEVDIAPGLLICPGTADAQAKLPTSAAEVLRALGVAVLMPLKSEDSVSFRASLKEAVLYLEKGEIWVAVEGAVTRGSQPFVRFATGTGGSQKGAFRADGDTSTAGVLPGCRFMSSTAGAGFAKVRLNLPATG
jgi:hypothetical protein